MKRDVSMRCCYVIVLLLLLFIAGCAAFTKYGKLEKNARTSYTQGNYEQAFYQCVNSLKLKPTYEKAQILVQDAYRSAVAARESNIERLVNSAAKFKWDDVVTEYEKLNDIVTTVKTLPTLTVKKTQEVITFETKDYHPELKEAKTNAAEAHYQEGCRLSKIKTLDVQKQAAKEFKAAQQYVFQYKDAASQYEICRKAGIKRMAIIPFDNKSGKSKYGAVEEMVTDNIISNVMSDPSAMEFLEIISRDQLMQVMHEQQLGLTGTLDEQTAVEVGKILGVHEMLTGKITQISYTPSRTSSRTYEDEKDVPTHKEKYVDNKGKTRERWVWQTVKATVTEYNKTASAAIHGSYKILEVATARIKKSESFEGKGGFYWDWGVARGDKRALSESSKRLISQSEQFAPSDDELVQAASQDLSTKLANTLKAYAR